MLPTLILSLIKSIVSHYFWHQFHIFSFLLTPLFHPHSLLMAFSFPWKSWSLQKRMTTCSHCHLHSSAYISTHRRHCPSRSQPLHCTPACTQPCLFKFCSLHSIYLAILIVSHQYISTGTPTLHSFSVTTPFPLFFYSWNFQLIFYTPCCIFCFSHPSVNLSHQAFATTTPPKLLSSRLLLIFLLLNSVVSF